MPSPSRFAHAVLKTYEVRKMRDWYLAALDARVVHESLPRFSFLTYDDEHHRLAFALQEGAPVKPNPRAPGLMHLAFGYPTARDLLVQYERMKGLGHKPVFPVNHGPCLSIYYADPDGNGVEFLVDRFATLAETQHFIDTHFDRNPVGVSVDPEELLAKMHKGASEKELLYYDEGAPMAKMPYEEMKAPVG